MSLRMIDPSAPEWCPDAVSPPRSRPSFAGLVPSLIVVATVALGACSSGGDPATVPATSAPTTSTTSTAPATSTVNDTSTVSPDGISGNGAFVERRLAFLIGLLDDPTSVTDDELAAQFSPAFLAQVPPAALRAAVTDATTGTTPPWSVQSSDLGDLGGMVTVGSADGKVLNLLFELDAAGDHLITTAQLLPAHLDQAFLEPGALDGADGIDAALDAVAQRVTYAVFDVADGDCRTLLERNADAVVPTGSVFKLWVLATLARAVRDGDAAWDETMPVTRSLRSSPDGEIYPLADGTPVTLERLAQLMISISDNTATDHLIARLGRERIEATIAELGLSTVDRNTPFLTTAELFTLKFVRPELGERYVELTTSEQRRELLDGEVAAAPLPWIDDPSWSGEGEITTPRLIDELEWFATPSDLCTTFDDLDRLAAEPGLEAVARILELNPGLPFPTGQWETIRFKGGSEPGVVMFAYWLEAPSGARRVVVVSLTDLDRAFDELDAVIPVARLHGLVARDLTT